MLRVLLSLGFELSWCQLPPPPSQRCYNFAFTHRDLLQCFCLTTLHKVFVGWPRGRVTVAGKEEVTTVFGLHMHEWSISGSELCRPWASRNNYCMFLEWPAPRSRLFSLMMSFLSFVYKSKVIFFQTRRSIFKKMKVLKFIKVAYFPSFIYFWRKIQWLSPKETGGNQQVLFKTPSGHEDSPWNVNNR